MKRLAWSLLLLSGLASAALADDAVRELKAKVDPDGVQRVAIVGGSYFFHPERVVVKVNVPVELTVRKEPGIVPHTFVLQAPDAGMDVDVSLATEPKTVRFTPRRVGDFPYYCSKKLLFLDEHREKGMAGILKVVE